jgi:hypothetical protein
MNLYSVSNGQEMEIVPNFHHLWYLIVVNPVERVVSNLVHFFNLINCYIRIHPTGNDGSKSYLLDIS